MRPIKLFILFFLLPVVLRGQVITTVAGTSYAENIPAVSAQLVTMGWIAFDTAGSFYFGQYQTSKVRKVSSSGIISTVAGNGSSGFSGDGGPAIAAQLNYPTGIAIDKKGDVYIADANNKRIRKVDGTTGIITTIVGVGTAGFSGDGGPAITAEISGQASLVFDTAGNLYIGDGGNGRIRKVDTFGIITTIAGDGNWGFGGDGGPATSAQLSGLEAMHFDKYNNLYVSNSIKIRRIDLTTGIITTVAGKDSTGYSGDGGPATNARITAALDVIPDACGNFYIPDEYSHVIRKVDSLGIIHTLAGNGVPGYTGDNGPAANAQLNNPRGVAMDAQGDLYVLDNSNARIRKITLNPTCIPTTVNDIRSASNITIYPNPAQNEITMTGLSNTKDIAIINTIGQTVIRQNCNGDKAALNV